MDLYINRRQWLKTSAIAAAGLFVSTNSTAHRRNLSFLRLTPAEEEELILLNNNESPYGISKIAREAIIESIDQSNRYPHKRYPELKKLIAEQENISPDHIILGAGSTEVMTMLIYLYGAKGEVLAADPTYFDFVYYVERANCPLHKVPLNDKFEHDLPALEKRISPKISLIYVCNPNNPTGSIVHKDGLHSFCERASRKAPVVVDEAYHEYVEDAAYASMIDLVKKGKNVVVTRTFSKIYGLAGLRVGYGMAKPEIIKSLEKVQMNFAPIAYLSLQAALASYKNFGFRRFVKEKNRHVKSYLYSELEKLGYFYILSHTNFVLFKVNRDAKEMARDFEGRHILVRPFVFMGNNWIRVSLGTLEEMHAFVSVLRDIS